MSRKTLIEISVIAVAFIGSGIVLYNGLSGGSGESATQTAVVEKPVQVLPYGQSFDYKQIDELKNRGFQFGTIAYPVLSTSTEVGKTSPSDMIQQVVIVGNH